MLVLLHHLSDAFVFLEFFLEFENTFEYWFYRSNQVFD